jgi:hypothetical protein
MSLPSPTTITIGTVGTVNSAFTGPQPLTRAQKANLVAQAASTVGGFAAGTGSAGAMTAIGTGWSAFNAGLVVLQQDRSTLSKDLSTPGISTATIDHDELTVGGDLLTLGGDLTTIASGYVGEFPVLNEAAPAVDGWGNIFTIGGLVLSNLDRVEPTITDFSSLANWAISTGNYQAFLSSDTNNLILNTGDAISNAWNSSINSLENTFNSISNFFSGAGTSSAAADTTAAMASINNAEQSFSNLYTTAGVAPQEITATINGSSETITSPSSTIGTATLDYSSSGLLTAVQATIDTGGAAGAPTTITYTTNSGGSITGVTITNATADITSSVNPNILEYTYTGPSFSTFTNPTGFTGTSPFQGSRVTASIVVDVNPVPPPNFSTVLEALEFSVSDGITSYTGPYNSSLDDVGGVTLGPNLQVGNYALSAFSSGVYGHPGSSEVSAQGYAPGYPGLPNGAGYDSGTYIDGSGNIFSAMTTTNGVWSKPIATTSVTISPLAGQTQSLSAVLTNPSLAAQGAVQTLTINGPGSVEETGVTTVPNVLDNGFILVGGSLDVSSAVDPTSSGIFFLTGKSDLEIASILGGANLKIQFVGSNSSNRLIIDSAAQFGENVGSSSYVGPLIQGFIAGDTIDLKSVASAGLGFAYTAASGDLQLTGSGKALATLAFQNSSLGAGTFHLASDGAGGTLITHS